MRDTDSKRDFKRGYGDAVGTVLEISEIGQLYDWENNNKMYDLGWKWGLIIAREAKAAPDFNPWKWDSDPDGAWDRADKAGDIPPWAKPGYGIRIDF